MPISAEIHSLDVLDARYRGSLEYVTLGVESVWKYNINCLNPNKILVVYILFNQNTIKIWRVNTLVYKEQFF